MKLLYIASGADSLDLVGTLWEKLREHQQNRSLHFAGHYAQRTFTRRKAELLKKSRGGALYVDLVKDTATDKIIGYCVCVVSPEKLGTLESIYIEPAYRKNHIGDKLMQRALRWLETQQAKPLVLTVGTGNEEVLDFYSRYKFYPKTIHLERAE